MFIAWPLVLVALIPILFFSVRRLRKPRPKKPHNVAELKSLNRLPSNKKVVRRARILSVAEIIIICLIITTLVVLISRPQATVKKIDEEKSRDIVMCVDISGSMSQFHQDTIDLTREVISDNPTDKYSLVLFSNASFTVLPLTRDLASINLRLDEVYEFLHPDNVTNEVKDAAFNPDKTGGTDIGEGLLGCLKRFSQLDEERSRHVIILSDMEHTTAEPSELEAGKLPPNNPDEIAELYAKFGVNLHILYPQGPFSGGVEESSVAKITSASTHGFEGREAVSSTLQGIFDTIQNADEVEEFVKADNPQPYWMALVILVGLLAAIDMLRRSRWL